MVYSQKNSVVRFSRVAVCDNQICDNSEKKRDLFVKFSLPFSYFLKQQLVRRKKKIYIAPSLGSNLVSNESNYVRFVSHT